MVRPRAARNAFSTIGYVSTGRAAPCVASSSLMPGRASPQGGAVLGRGAVHAGRRPCFPSWLIVCHASAPAMTATSARPAAISSHRWFTTDWGVFPPSVV